MKQKELFRQLAMLNRVPKLLCNFSEKEYPFIIMGDVEKLDIMCLRLELYALSDDEAYVIGRSRNADKKTLYYPNLSRIHCFIIKTDTGDYALYDTSKAGTRVMGMTSSPQSSPSLRDKIRNFWNS